MHSRSRTLGAAAARPDPAGRPSRSSTPSQHRRDTHTDPESRLLVHEELMCVLRALSILSDGERIALAGVIDGECYERLGPALGRTAKGASQVVYRARRKLARALLREA